MKTKKEILAKLQMVNAERVFYNDCISALETHLPTATDRIANCYRLHHDACVRSALLKWILS